MDGVEVGGGHGLVEADPVAGTARCGLAGGFAEPFEFTDPIAALTCPFLDEGVAFADEFPLSGPGRILFAQQTFTFGVQLCYFGGKQAGPEFGDEQPDCGSLRF